MKAFLLNIIKRFKSPVVILGIVMQLFSIIAVAASVDINALSSWQALGSALLSIVSNPIVLVTFLANLFAILNDPTSKKTF